MLLSEIRQTVWLTAWCAVARNESVAENPDRVAHWADAALSAFDYKFGREREFIVPAGLSLSEVEQRAWADGWWACQRERAAAAAAPKVGP
jgi:hypothetical protein